MQINREKTISFTLFKIGYRNLLLLRQECVLYIRNITVVVYKNYYLLESKELITMKLNYLNVFFFIFKILK